MSITRVAAQSTMNRIVKSSSYCQLHRIYKISFENGRNYVGQTKKFPEERVKEHTRPSSKCTFVKENMQNNKFSVETIAITGYHNVDVMEKVAIVLEKTMCHEGGLNITIGGPGVKKPDEKYDIFAKEVRDIAEQIRKNKFVSWDILFMKEKTNLTEEEFKAVMRLSQSKSRV